MKRDMELVRKILFKIEKTVGNVAEYDLSMEGYSMEQIVYHCVVLEEGGYIYNYVGDYGDGELNSFGV